MKSLSRIFPLLPLVHLCHTEAWILPLASHKVTAQRLATEFQESSSSNEETVSSSRRQWLTSVASATITAGCLSLLPADAANLISTTSVCDPSVSVWKRDGRLVYLLGTAHISSASAELAGNLVKDIHPKGVFVELDPKRIKGSGILAKKLEGGMDEGLSSSKVIVPNIQRIALSNGAAPTSQLVASVPGDGAAAAMAVATPTPKPNPVMRAASTAVGNQIKGMYKKMDDAGFQAGEEFVVAIREGQKMGADIILGDRDVEVTLQRVTAGLAKTDVKALLNPDSELEQTMRELVPSQSVTPDSDVGDLNDEEFKNEFSTFVETMKAKDNVRKIMGQLQRIAPALYEALVSERDTYMAAGLNGLDELESIVAVVGIAHVDGIERNLEMNGWKAAQPTCAVKT